MNSMKEKLRTQSLTMVSMTILVGLAGAGIFVVIKSFEIPYIMVTLLKFGLAPALTVIVLVGAIRGPIAGFLVGYFGVIIRDLLFFNTVAILTLPAMAYGVLGLVVGLGSYDFSNGRSLGKLSLVSAIGLVFTALLLTMIGLFIEQTSVLANLGFVLLPLLSTGLPTVILVTPILARLWSVVSLRLP